MKSKEVTKFLNISRATLCRLVRKGDINANELPGGRFDYDEQSVLEFHNKKTNNRDSIYIKLPLRSKEDMESQSKALQQFCTSNNHKIKDITIEITNKIHIEELKEFFENLDNVVKIKVKKIIVFSLNSTDECSLNLICNILKEYSCELSIMNEVKNLSDLDANKSLSKSNIKVFSCNSIYTKFMK